MYLYYIRIRSRNRDIIEKSQPDHKRPSSARQNVWPWPRVKCRFEFVVSILAQQFRIDLMNYSLRYYCLKPNHSTDHYQPPGPVAVSPTLNSSKGDNLQYRLMIEGSLIGHQFFDSRVNTPIRHSTYCIFPVQILKKSYKRSIDC